MIHENNSGEVNRGKGFECCCSITRTNFEIDELPVIQIINCILNIPTSLTATLGNVLVLISMWRTPSLHSPSNLLLVGLALSDLSVGIIVQPIFLINSIAKMKGLANLFCISSVLVLVIGATLCGVSLMTLTAISVDRYTALYLHLRYKEIVTLKRVFAILVSIWLACILYGVSYLWNPTIQHYLSVIFIFFGLLVGMIAYCMIYQVVRHHQAQIQAIQVGQQEPNSLNLSTHRKSFVNMLLIYFVFLFCYLPFLVARAVILSTGPTVSKHSAIEITFSLVSINSTLNPLLYCWRFQNIRAAVNATTRRLFSESSRTGNTASSPPMN